MNQKIIGKKWTTTLVAGIAALFIAIGAGEVAAASTQSPASDLQQCMSKCSPAEQVCMQNAGCKYSPCVNDSKGKPIPSRLETLQASCKNGFTKCADLCNNEYKNASTASCSPCDASYSTCKIDQRKTATTCCSEDASCRKQHSCGSRTCS